MIFVDTGAWYASLVPTDPDHARAVQWLATNHSPLLTTDYVIDETLTLLRVRGERSRARFFGAQLFQKAFAEIHKITMADLTLAWQTFEQFDDKNWSFTDTSSICSGGSSFIAFTISSIVDMSYVLIVLLALNIPVSRKTSPFFI